MESIPFLYQKNNALAFDESRWCKSIRMGKGTIFQKCLLVENDIQDLLLLSQDLRPCLFGTEENKSRSDSGNELIKQKRSFSKLWMKRPYLLTGQFWWCPQGAHYLFMEKGMRERPTWHIWARVSMSLPNACFKALLTNSIKIAIICLTGFPTKGTRF